MRFYTNFIILDTIMNEHKIKIQTQTFRRKHRNLRLFIWKILMQSTAFTIGAILVVIAVGAILKITVSHL